MKTYLLNRRTGELIDAADVTVYRTWPTIGPEDMGSFDKFVTDQRDEAAMWEREFSEQDEPLDGVVGRECCSCGEVFVPTVSRPSQCSDCNRKGYGK